MSARIGLDSTVDRMRMWSETELIKMHLLQLGDHAPSWALSPPATFQDTLHGRKLWETHWVLDFTREIVAVENKDDLVNKGTQAPPRVSHAWYDP